MLVCIDTTTILSVVEEGRNSSERERVNEGIMGRIWCNAYRESEKREEVKNILHIFITIFDYKGGDMYRSHSRCILNGFIFGFDFFYFFFLLLFSCILTVEKDEKFCVLENSIQYYYRAIDIITIKLIFLSIINIRQAAVANIAFRWTRLRDVKWMESKYLFQFKFHIRRY